VHPVAAGEMAATGFVSMAIRLKHRNGQAPHRGSKRPQRLLTEHRVGEFLRSFDELAADH
jgi:hypothetical protein